MWGDHTRRRTGPFEQSLDADSCAKLVAGDALVKTVVVRLKLLDVYRYRTFTWPLADTWLRVHVQLSAVLRPPVPVLHSRHT